MSDFRPYKQWPDPNDVAILIGPDHIVDSAGTKHRLHGKMRGVSIYGTWDQIMPWWNAGHGRVRCWAKKKILWIHPSGTIVHFIPDEFPPGDEALEGLRLWRNALAEYGASPSGMGSSAFSLFRATTKRHVQTYRNHVPALAVLGGRIGQNYPAGAYKGPIVQWDLPAAYASAIGGLRWGGWWSEHDHAPRALDQMTDAGMCVFAHAEIRIPAGHLIGPVPRRPRRELTVWQSLLRPLRVEVYPTNRRLRGVWTWEEIMAARDTGCGVTLHKVWIHHSGEYPFAPWWEAVQELRALPGYAGFLGKMMGNAFFGQLIVRDDGNLVEKWVEPETRHVLRERIPPKPGMRPRHIHAAETVTGRVRANLFTHVLYPMNRAVLSWHTDGAWVFNDENLPTPIGWREKARAVEMDFIDASTYVYRPGEGEEPVWTFSGVPKHLRRQEFDTFWGGITHDWKRRKRLIPR